jgi:hypothetical protein
MSIKEGIAIALDSTEKYILEFKAGSLLSQNDVSCLGIYSIHLKKYAESEFKRGYEVGFDEGEMAGYKAGKGEDAPSKDESPIIGKKALLKLCLDYDIKYGDYPESSFEGQALYEFLLCRRGEAVEQFKDYSSWAKRSDEYLILLERRRREEGDIK